MNCKIHCSWDLYEIDHEGNCKFVVLFVFQQILYIALSIWSVHLSVTKIKNKIYTRIYYSVSSFTILIYTASFHSYKICGLIFINNKYGNGNMIQWISKCWGLNISTHFVWGQFAHSANPTKDNRLSYFFVYLIICLV